MCSISLADVHIQFFAADLCHVWIRDFQVAKGVMPPQKPVAITTEMKIVLAGQTTFGGYHIGIWIMVGHIIDGRVGVAADTTVFSPNDFSHQQWDSRSGQELKCKNESLCISLSTHEQTVAAFLDL